MQLELFSTRTAAKGGDTWASPAGLIWSVIATSGERITMRRGDEHFTHTMTHTKSCWHRQGWRPTEAVRAPQ